MRVTDTRVTDMRVTDMGVTDMRVTDIIVLGITILYLIIQLRLSEISRCHRTEDFYSHVCRNFQHTQNINNGKSC